MKNRYKIKIRFKLLFLTLIFSLFPIFTLIFFIQKNIYDYLIINSREFNFKSLQQFTNNVNFIIEKRKKDLEDIKQSQFYKEIENFDIKERIDELIFYKNLNDRLKEYVLSKEIGDLIVIDFKKISLLKSSHQINIYSDIQYIVDTEELQKEDFFLELEKINKQEGYVLATIKRSSILGYDVNNRLLLINFIKENKNIKKILILVLKENFFIEIFKFIKYFDNAKIIIVDKNNGIIDIEYSYNDETLNKIYKKISLNFNTKDNILEEPVVKRLANSINKNKISEQIGKDNYYSIINYENQKFMVLIYYNWEQDLTYYSILPLRVIFSSVNRTIISIIIIALIIFVIILVSSVVSSKLIATPIETKTELIQDENIYFMNIAHELKTPLTVISNYLDKYLKEYGDNKDIEIIKNNIENLKREMIDFLDFGKIERGQPFYNHNQSINLSDALKNKIVAFSVSANQKNIVFNKKIEDNIYIKIDPFALDRILNNLLDNAIKYNKENGIVEIILEAKNNRVFFTISDTGIGISEKKIKNLFNPFTQLAEGSKNSGVGLGLFIIKKIIDEINGKINVESKLNKGTKFSIEFSLAKKEIPLLKEKNIDLSFKKSDQRNIILIVEDNEDLLNYLAISLQEYFNIETATNGVIALEKLKTIKPDLIISDIMMPEMNGFELFDSINNKENYKDIPFVFLSAINSIEYKIKGFETGAVDYIVKPFRIEELFARINSLLRFKKLKEALYEKDKYATIGMLVAGISHEILNPLSGIYAPLENIEKILKNNENLNERKKLQNFIDNIWVNVKRIDSIIKNLKMLFYNDNFNIDKKEIKIEEIINTILELFYNKIKNRIDVIKKIEKDITVSTNYSILMQILLNLISNAIDAIKEQGTIIIEGYKKDNKLIINIIDNGCGIEQENLKNIFMPFWTTKEIGKGTGLGLYIVKNLIDKLNWQIEVSSSIGSGTKFTIIAQ